jgi:hypothetical protein
MTCLRSSDAKERIGEKESYRDVVEVIYKVE